MMPFVHIRIATSMLNSDQISKLQIEATDLMANVMRKKKELTAVFVERVDPVGWSVGGKPIPVAAHLEVKVTTGTNTLAEKTAFVAKADSLLKTVIGSELPLATYVVIHEISADAWGYDGQTQASRLAASTPA